MVKCPKCDREAGPPIKTWEMKGRVQGSTRNETDPKKHNKVLIGQYVCQHCDHKFRKGVKIP